MSIVVARHMRARYRLCMPTTQTLSAETARPDALRLSDSLQPKAARFVVLDRDECVMFGGRQWDDPLAAAEHALDEHGAGYLSEGGYEVREEDFDGDGTFSVLVAQVTEVSL